MFTIICTICGQPTEVDHEQFDADQYICKSCRERFNLPKYRQELEELESIDDKKEPILRRIEYLKKKITSITK